MEDRRCGRSLATQLGRRVVSQRLTPSLMGSFDAAIGPSPRDQVGEGPPIIDSLDEMSQERLPDERSCPFETPGRVINGHESSGQHDAVGILDRYCTTNIEGTVGFDFQEEPEVRCGHLDPIQRPLPFDDPQTGLFSNLPGQGIHERLAGIDDTTRSTPIDRLVPALVLDQQDLTSSPAYDAACHLPLPQGG